MAAAGSPSPKLVPTKASVNPARSTQAPSEIHFQYGMGIDRSSAHARAARMNMQKSTPSRNQKNPVVKKLMVPPPSPG